MSENDIDAFLANYYRSRRTIPKLHFDYVSRRKPKLFHTDQEIRDIFKEEYEKQQSMSYRMVLSNKIGMPTKFATVNP